MAGLLPNIRTLRRRMHVLRLVVVFAISCSLVLVPLAGSVAIAAGSSSAVSELAVGATHDCCDHDQAPVDVMKDCQASAACAKCFNFFETLFFSPTIHPPVIELEPNVIEAAIYASPNHPPFRPPRA